MRIVKQKAVNIAIDVHIQEYSVVYVSIDSVIMLKDVTIPLMLIFLSVTSETAI